MIGVIGTRLGWSVRAGDETSANLNLAQRDLPADFQIGADRPLLVEAFRCVSFHRSGYGVGVGVGLLFPGSCFSPALRLLRLPHKADTRFETGIRNDCD
jgi:hypothetical protein